MTELQVLKDNIRVLLKLEYGTDFNIENDWNLLWYLCENNRKELIEDLVQESFDVDIKDDDGDTLLMWASWYGNLEIIKILLKNNADPNIQNNNGDNVFFWVRNSHPEIIKLLKKYGAKK